MFVENVWDPLSLKQSCSLKKVVQQLADDYPLFVVEEKNAQVKLCAYSLLCITFYFNYVYNYICVPIELIAYKISIFHRYFFKTLIKAVDARISKCLKDDIFMPLYGKKYVKYCFTILFAVCNFHLLCKFNKFLILILASSKTEILVLPCFSTGSCILVSRFTNIQWIWSFIKSWTDVLF